MLASSCFSFCWACALSAPGLVDHAFGRGLLMGDEPAMPSSDVRPSSVHGARVPGGSAGVHKKPEKFAETDISQMDGAHPRLGAGIPPSWPRNARIFRLLAGGERALTPATGVRCSPSGLTAAPRGRTAGAVRPRRPHSAMAGVGTQREAHANRLRP